MNTRFLDGPAAGTSLGLIRSPVVLRAVQGRGGKWDALDQVGDLPNEGERIVVYVLASKIRTGHVSCRPRSKSFFFSAADYRVWDPQPLDMQVRERADFEAWCDQHAAEILRRSGEWRAAGPAGERP